jgi:hypothetical protein
MPMMAAIAKAAYTRGDGVGGFGLAKFRYTGQWIGHSKLHANLPLAQILTSPEEVMKPGPNAHIPANKLAGRPWGALIRGTRIVLHQLSAWQRVSSRPDDRVLSGTQFAKRKRNSSPPEHQAPDRDGQ